MVVSRLTVNKATSVGAGDHPLLTDRARPRQREPVDTAQASGATRCAALSDLLGHAVDERSSGHRDSHILGTRNGSSTELDKTI